MFFLYFLFTMLQFSTKVIWSDYTIDVNLGGDVLTELKNIEANLIINNELKDAEIIYRYDGVERTFLSTINTKIVKTYNHKIEAYFPDYNVREIINVTINIKDNIKPSFSYIKEFRVHINSKLPDLLEDIKVNDNYNDESELIIKVDSSKIILSRLGKYPVIYKVTDQSGNFKEELTYFYVEDYKPPEIKVLKPLVHQVNELFNWETYFKITDDDMFVKVNIGSFDLNTLGEYPFYLKATDSSGNITELETFIEIVDNKPPELVIAKERPNIAFGDENYIKKLRSFIVSVKDNYAILTKDDVIIETNLNPFELGTYEVLYIIKDTVNLKEEIKIQIKVTDQMKPIIAAEDYYIFEIFSAKPIMENLIFVEDDVTLFENIKLTITGTYNIDKIGEYPLNIKAVDEAGNSSNKNIIIKIVDSMPPEITKLDEIIIFDFIKPNYNWFYSISDKYDKNPSLYVDDSLVDYNKIGKYEIEVKAFDEFNNEKVIKDFVLIKDIFEPEIILYQNKLYLNKSDKNFDFKSVIMEVKDNYDNLTINDVVIKNNVDFDSTGEQFITFILIDSSNNIAEQILAVNIYESAIENIYLEPLIINQNDEFAFEKENFENLNDYKVFIYPQAVDSSAPGKHLVSYVLINNSGTTKIVEREIIVVSSVKNKQFIKYLPIAILFLIGCSISVILVVKKKKHIF